MKIYAPSYYKEFKCLADKCKNSCCIGWAIEIDRDTVDMYRRMNGSVADKIRSSLVEENDSVSFRLGNGGRCPLLRDDGLCEIICEVGEDAISEICKKHPRFYHYHKDRTEVGLGISCEAAAQLVLYSEDKPHLIPLSGDGQNTDCEDDIVVSARDEIIRSITDTDIPFADRLSALKAKYRIPKVHTPSEWFDFLIELECLDSDWRELLRASNTRAGDSFLPIRESDSAQAERLLSYFIYRHLTEATDEEDFRARVGFACLCTELVFNIYYAVGGELVSVARRFSAEIEYSTDNTEEIISEFDFYFSFEEL